MLAHTVLAVEVGGGVERVAVGAHGAGAEGFEHDEDDVGRPGAVDAVRLHALLAGEVQALWVRLVDAEVAGQGRVVLAHLGFVVLGLAGLEGVVEEQHGVQAQGGDLAVAGEVGIAPAQGHGVFQVEVFYPAQQAEEHGGDAQGADAGQGPAAQGLRRAVEGPAFQAQQGVAPQAQGAAPGEDDPQHRVAFPEHLPGDLCVVQVAQHRGVDAHAEVGVVAEVDDVQQPYPAQHQQQVGSGQPAQSWQPQQVPARQPGQQGQGQQ